MGVFGTGGERQRGAILLMMAVMLVVLMGVAAMAVDLGWLYWQSIEIQHGADSAALAGVVYEPDLRTQAKSEALAMARTNGFDDDNAGTTVEVTDFVDDDTSVVNESMLRVTITQSVPTFFLKIFGMNQIEVQRTAVAEYVQPLALGSPEAYFGDDPATGNEPGFWADSTSNYVAKEGGNRFGALCLHNGFGRNCREESSSTVRGLNPEGLIPSGWGTQNASGGYLYGIEVKEGSSAGLTVEIFNGPLYTIRKSKLNPLPPTGSGNFAGDSKYNPSNEYNHQTTWFMLYGPDPTPADTTDGNELLCSIAYSERNPTVNTSADKPPNSSAYAADFGSLGWDNSWLEFDQVPQNILNAMWDDMSNSQFADYQTGSCAAGFDRGPGIYVLRVLDVYDSTGITDPKLSWRGSNHYSLRASVGGPDQPSVFAIENMVMSAARNTSVTEFYLARVDQRYAGKSLIIELWDVGDIDPDGPNGDHFLIRDGTGATVDCEWTATDTSPLPNSQPNPTSSGGVGECRIDAYDRIFNDELITIISKIPDDYTCSGTGCWWTIKYNYAGGTVKDTTTWTAYIDGNPIRIVE